MIKGLELTGVIEEVLGNNNYRVKVVVQNQERSLLCYLSGRIRQYNINVAVGDPVRLILPPPYDKGRIVFRG